MAKPHERVFAMIGALLFLATSVAVSVAVIVQIRRENQQQKELNNIQTSLEKASDAQSQSDSTNSSSNDTSNQTNGGTKLEGTKLEGFTPVATVDSLQIIDLQVGTGDEVKAGATVTAHYTGALAKDGTIFESSHDGGQPATFPLSNVIKGWQDGVPGMKVGGKRRLIIPSAQAYGEAGGGSKIGPNEPLVFDIEMVSVQQ